MISRVDGKSWDVFWDSPPMAITLEAAARHFTQEAVDLLGLPPTSFLARHRDEIERASKIAHERLTLTPSLPVQKTYYEELRKGLYGRIQTTLFERRLSEAFAPVCSPVPVID